MAGSQTRAQQIALLKDELEARTSELEDLKHRVALNAPHLLNPDADTKRTEYTDDIPDVIQALASQGKTESQWIADLGIDEQTWNGWRERYPALAQAIPRARARFRAYLESRAMAAMNDGRNFPKHIFDMLLEAHDPQTGQANPDDDASRFVILDLRAEG